MIPSDIKFEGNAAPPQWTDGADQVIEKGTHIRIKIKGIRSEVDKMYAVGTMKEVSVASFWNFDGLTVLTTCRITLAPCLSNLTTALFYLANAVKVNILNRWREQSLRMSRLSALEELKLESLARRALVLRPRIRDPRSRIWLIAVLLVNSCKSGGMSGSFVFV